MEELLRYDHVDISYNGILAVQDVSFTLRPGEILGIVGESGCGKSTLLKAAMGLLGSSGMVTRGDIWYKGRNLPDLPARALRKLNGPELGMIFQSAGSSFCPIRTVGAQLYEVMTQHGSVAKKEFENCALELLEKLGFEDGRRILRSYPFELSGGMQQRVGIARALAVKPEFIVCDEPISALDVSIQSQVVNMLEDMQAEMGLTYLFIAHDLSVVRHISNRIGVMYLGSLVELGESYELNRHPIHPYTQTLLSAVPVPDPKLSRTRKRIILEGDVPSPMNPPSGCRFHTRCPYATQKCREEMPQFKEHEPGHWAACHLLDK